MSRCIICLQEHSTETVEHIVPRSLGNIHYVLSKGQVCRNCNNRFARFEHEVVASAPFMQRRLKLGVIDKIPPNTRKLAKLPLQLFLLKVFYESIHHSRPKLILSQELNHIRQDLFHTRVNDIYPIDQDYNPKKRLPNLIDHWRLTGAGIGLHLDEEPPGVLRFNFSYSDMSFNIGIQKKPPFGGS